MDDRSTGHRFTLAGETLIATPQGCLWWPEARLMVVSDLHLGKSGRMARRHGVLLPPYETAETLARLATEVARLGPDLVLCLGDSFDDAAAAAALGAPEAAMLAALASGRRWIWIEGNHDTGLAPGPGLPAGEHHARFGHGPLSFGHIADPGARFEISGHYHPKARLAGRSRACFLIDATRVILPAFGTYTGGLACTAPVLDALMGPGALAVLTGPRALAMPMRGRPVAQTLRGALR